MSDLVIRRVAARIFAGARPHGKRHEFGLWALIGKVVLQLHHQGVVEDVANGRGVILLDRLWAITDKDIFGETKEEQERRRAWKAVYDQACRHLDDHLERLREQ